MNFLRKRPTMVAAILITAAVAFIVIRGESIKTRVDKVERDAPCTGLTTRQCALKLLKALSPAQRRQIVEAAKTPKERRAIREIIRRLEREQANRRRRGSGRARARTPRGVAPVAGLPPRRRSPRSPTSSAPPPATSGPQPGSSPQQPGSPPESPRPDSPPILRPPLLQTPQIGPVPPAVVQLPSVPCTETIVTKC